MSRAGRTCALCLAMALTAAATMHAQSEVVAGLPRSVYVAPCLRPLIAQMLERSPTFRAQVETLGRARGIGISIDLKVASRPQRAQATIRRYGSGLLLAAIHIQTILDQPALIAHELEHVLEQIEGVQLARVAARSSTDAWQESGNWETRRAIEAGDRVASEMRAPVTLTARASRPSP